MKNRVRLYIRCVFGILHIAVVKLFNIRGFSSGLLQDFSFGTRIFVGRGSKMRLGRKIHTRGSVVMETLDGGELSIEDGCSFNRGCMIVSGDKITIGRKTAFAPNVMVYDHDHNTYRSEENEESYKFSPITIGSRVWIGANSVILRGSVIGDGCVIGAGSVIKGTYPPNTIIIQKRSDEIRKTAMNEGRKGGEIGGGETGDIRLEGLAHSS